METQSLFQVPVVIVNPAVSPEWRPARTERHYLHTFPRSTYNLASKTYFQFPQLPSQFYFQLPDKKKKKKFFHLIVPLTLHYTITIFIYEFSIGITVFMAVKVTCYLQVNTIITFMSCMLVPLFLSNINWIMEFI